MRWKINRSIYTPLSLLPYSQRHYPAILQLEPLFTTVSKKPSILGPQLGDSNFEVRYRESWEKMSLCPWKSFLDAANPIDLKKAYYAEVAIALRLFDTAELLEPLSPGKIYHQFTKENFPQNLQEAFAFALFDLKLPLDNLDWKNDVRHVIHEGKPLARLRKPDSVLLSHGYQLLDLISQQRQSHPEQLLKAWEEFNQQATIKLPLIFAIVYWNELADTQMLLEKQQSAVNELLNLLPHLSKEFKGDNLFAK
ncbi:hypothetical protein PN36_26290 [Candidatus Thiomargarita nelsonii]|uniref:Uncharacterized protein n=1 Tax=Candidatus Thiomargarita nelsonii TaxID=1003181 RepID=A0A0A6P955_9GAMM|nr:hypothetical protein PN36_26290 [Candidatus Thiomargarita nelsonii]